MWHCTYDPYNPCEHCGKCGHEADEDERDPDREYELWRDENNENEE